MKTTLKYIREEKIASLGLSAAYIYLYSNDLQSLFPLVQNSIQFQNTAFNSDSTIFVQNNGAAIIKQGGTYQIDFFGVLYGSGNPTDEQHIVLSLRSNSQVVATEEVVVNGGLLSDVHCTYQGAFEANTTIDMIGTTNISAFLDQPGPSATSLLIRKIN